MDRPTTRQDAEAPSPRPFAPEAFVLTSRRSALDLCRGVLAATPNVGPAVGPILLTGEAGVGKTWLSRRLEAESPASTRWVSVDLTPANTPADFYRLIAHELGLADSCASASAAASGRVELIDFLAERQADGQRLTLVIDEAQNLAMPVWEEVKILANRLDRPGGFCRMVLVGQTSLARRFATRPFAAIEARLAARVHLGAIDADEASELVARFYPGRSLSTDEIEILHRDSGGNPRRILRKLGPIPATRQLAVEAAEPVFKKPVAAAPAVLSPPPLIGPAKPPIRVDENMIEVGWAADDAATLDEADASPTSLSPVSTTVEAGEEAVSDHYAALQAWREWADNQARRVQVPAVAAEQAAGSTMPLDDSDDDEIDFDPDPDDLPVSRSDRPRVRPEGEQKFAPFGQLFSRMAQSHDSE